jgi:hypothetical protein
VVQHCKVKSVEDLAGLPLACWLINKSRQDGVGVGSTRSDGGTNMISLSQLDAAELNRSWSTTQLPKSLSFARICFTTCFAGL